MAIRAQVALILAKIQVSAGTDPTPTPTSDAIEVENPEVDFDPTIIETNEVSHSLDPNTPIVGGMKGMIKFTTLLKGSGVAGTAPEIGPLLKACGWAETVTATAVPAAPEACAAGGSTTMAVLGTSASTTADAYTGMPINISGTVTLASFIAAYTAAKNATLTDTAGGSIVATSNYQIPVNVRYAPASASIPALFIYAYMDGILYKLSDCIGTFQLSLDGGGIGRINWEFRGLFVSKTDAAIPTTEVYDATRAPVWKSGICKMNRIASSVNQLSFDCGATVAFPTDPNQTEGFGYPLHTARRITGSIDPLEELVATRDIMAAFRAGTTHIIHARLGATTGNKVGLTFPGGLYTGHRPGNRERLATVTAPFFASGRDLGALLCFY